MNILQVVPYFFPSAYGGPGKTVYDLSRSLARLGHKITIFTSDCFDMNNRMPNSMRLHESDIRMYYFRNLSNALAYRFHFFFPLGMVIRAAGVIPHMDIVHIHDFYIDLARKYEKADRRIQAIKVYEKILDGVWSLKGYFGLIDYKIINDGKRDVFRFILQLADNPKTKALVGKIVLEHNRLIPSEVKKEVWKRDKGKCVQCGSTDNLHFDHILPFVKGGTSLKAENIQLLCARHNLQKRDKII